MNQCFSLKRMKVLPLAEYKRLINQGGSMTLAERLRRQIVYIPKGALSPSRLKRIRVFHILSGFDKREAAKEFIV